jgi:hypothetical protein
MTLVTVDGVGASVKDRPGAAVGRAEAFVGTDVGTRVNGADG